MPGKYLVQEKYYVKTFGESSNCAKPQLTEISTFGFLLSAIGDGDVLCSSLIKTRRKNFYFLIP